MTQFSPFLVSAALLAGLLFLALAWAGAQPGSFVSRSTESLWATATVTFRPTAKGSDTTSVVRVSMQGLNYALSKDRGTDGGQPTAPRATERDGEQLRGESDGHADPGSFC